MAELGQPPFEQMTVAQAREAGVVGFTALQGPGPEVASVAHRFIPGPTADLPVRVYIPAGEGPFPAIVYYHGSGWVITNIEVCDASMRALANDTGCVVVAVNYQKAPEHKFPVPFNDSWAGLTWVVGHAEELNVDPARIAVGGDSAGGNLAAVAALRAREVLRGQLLVYPALDAAMAGDSFGEFVDGAMFTTSDMALCWRTYLGDDAADGDPDASPLAARDLGGLPPAYIAVAAHDPLRDDGLRYAAALREAGVPVVVDRYDDMVHGFLRWGGVVDRARELIDALADFARDAIAR
jgi:acetyl esterase